VPSIPIRGRAAFPVSFTALLVLLVTALGIAPSASAAEPTWTHQTTPAAPTARSASAMASDSSTGQTLLFGGTDGTGWLEETWDWNGSTWTQLSPTNSPSAREGAAMTYDSSTEQLLLFGGFGENGELGDTWSWDGTAWTELSPAQPTPALRGNAAMAYDAATEEVVLFGGFGEEGYLGETWCWDGTAWAEMAPSASPPALSDAAMAYDAATEEVILFGGSGAAGQSEETWGWNGTTWTDLSGASGPSARADASMVEDPATGQVILFGGVDENGPLGETWAWDGSGWTPRPTSGGPDPRGYAAMAYEPTNERVVLFGGTDQISYFADTWTYAPSHPPVKASIATPASGGVYVIGEEVPIVFNCEEVTTGAGGLAACDTEGLAGAGASTLDTSTLGEHTAAVTAIAGNGEEDRAAITYTVVKAQPTLASPASFGPSGAISALATLVGAHLHEGTVTFSLYVPGSDPCAGSPLWTSSPVPLSPDGTAASPTFIPTDSGTYRWVADYSGDADDEPASSACDDPAAAVTVDKGESKPPAEPGPRSDQPPAGQPPAKRPAHPSVRITWSPNRSHAHNSGGGPRYTFRFSAPDPDATFLCSLDKSPFAHCTSPQVYGHLKRGRHVFRVISVAEGAGSPIQKVVFIAGRRPSR
jgi:hypothetical protein